MEIKRTVWFVSGNGCSRIGPFAAQHLAYEAVKLTTYEREQQKQETGVDSTYPHDVKVWPEYSETDAFKG
jgi:hypothetical protein